MSDILHQILSLSRPKAFKITIFPDVLGDDDEEKIAKKIGKKLHLVRIGSRFGGQSGSKNH